MGLNLQKANRLIYFTLPWGLGSCGLWEQSKKRIHRIGQKNTCFYYTLLCRDTVEITNLATLQQGKELTDELFKE
jgi:SNF2 family DNA or RNA helicase